MLGRILLFGLVFWSAGASNALAEDVRASCQQLLEQKSNAATHSVSSFDLLLKLVLNRRNLIDTLNVGTATSSVVSSSGDDEVTLFILGTNPALTREHKATIKNIAQMQKPAAKRIRVLLSTQSVDECVNTAKRIHWDISEITELQDLKVMALDAYRRREARLSLKVARKALRKHPNWRVIAVDTWGEILQGIRKSPSAGIIIIAHADPNGRLYDSNRGEFPTSFFRSLPEAVRFIGVFSCESESVIRAYGLDRLNSKEVVAVKLRSPLDRTSSTPLLLFPEWARKLPSVGPKAISSEAECTARFHHLHLIKGDLAVSMNGKAVGVWSAATADSVQVFPCALLKGPGQNTVFLEPTRAYVLPNQFTVELTDFSFELQIEGTAEPFVLKPQKVFEKAGSFRSAIMR